MFFSDPLIKYIWANVFIRETTDICLGYLRKIRSHPDQGKEFVDRLVGDMIETEAACNLTMLPDAAKYTDIQVFSQ